MSRRSAGAVTAALAAAAALALPAAAAAHPRLLEAPSFAGATVASGPRAVALRFSEPVEPVGAGIRVTGPDGHDAAAGAVRSQGGILSRRVDARGRGTYAVEWVVVGHDGHPARGAFLFSVGEQTRSVLPGGGGAGTWLQALGRMLSLAGFALGFGVPFAAALSGGMSRRLWRLVSAGIVLMLAAEPVALLGETATLAPGRWLDPALARDVLQTSYGHLAGLRLGAAVALWALGAAVRQGPPRALWAIPALGGAVALVHADAAHRVAELPSTLSLLLAATHTAAFAAWLGCVVVVLSERRAALLARPAVVAALVLVLSGSGLALGHLETPGDLAATGYGRTLAVKAAFVGAALALGAAARRRAELAAGLLVVAAAALLVSLLPPA